MVGGSLWELETYPRSISTQMTRIRTRKNK
jgi:hypothetical protein